MVPQLDKNERSIRRLLEKHGFVGTDAQKRALDHLQDQCKVTIGTFRRPIEQKQRAYVLEICRRPIG